MLKVSTRPFFRLLMNLDGIAALWAMLGARNSNRVFHRNTFAAPVGDYIDEIFKDNVHGRRIISWARPSVAALFKLAHYQAQDPLKFFRSGGLADS
jgi:hypothetical protein